MRRYTIYCCLAFAFLFLSACSSEPEKPKEKAPETAKNEPPPPPVKKDMISGTWVINLAKSRYSPADAAPKSGTSKLEMTSDGIHVTAEGVDSKGRKTLQDYTAKFDGPPVPNNAMLDGKPNPAPDADSQAWKKIDDYTFENTGSLKGKAVMTTKVVVAGDGKTRTNTQTGTNAAGKKIDNTVVYDKQ